MNEGLTTSELESLVWRAREFAMNVHAGQKRHDGNEYIVHPFGVALILMEAGAEPEVVAAGYLHDVIEKTHITYEDLVREFGEDVAEMVQDVSDPKIGDWRQKKEIKLRGISRMPIGSQMIIAADKINNLNSLAEAIHFQGSKFLNKFDSSLNDRLLMDLRVLYALLNTTVASEFPGLTSRFSTSWSMGFAGAFVNAVSSTT